MGGRVLLVAVANLHALALRCVGGLWNAINTSANYSVIQVRVSNTCITLYEQWLFAEETAVSFVHYFYTMCPRQALVPLVIFPYPVLVYVASILHLSPVGQR